jgi:hypothetical protein
MADPELEAIRQASFGRLSVHTSYYRSYKVGADQEFALQKRLADLASRDDGAASSVPSSVMSKLGGQPAGGGEEEAKKAENEE